MSKEIKQIVELTVVRVIAGGNAGDGGYFYSFSPDILLSEAPGKIIYRLSEDSSQGLQIRTVVDSASDGQMSPPEIKADGSEAIVQNHLIKPELINVAVIVIDLERPGLFIKCDPQVLNVPDPAHIG